jgi:hypothetical protein
MIQAEAKSQEIPISMDPCDWLEEQVRLLTEENASDEQRQRADAR